MKSKLRKIGNVKHSKLSLKFSLLRRVTRKTRIHDLFKSFKKIKKMPQIKNCDGEVGTIRSFRFVSMSGDKT